jgi:hypothetical protein
VPQLHPEVVGACAGPGHQPDKLEDLNKKAKAVGLKFFGESSRYYFSCCNEITLDDEKYHLSNFTEGSTASDTRTPSAPCSGNYQIHPLSDLSGGVCSMWEEAKRRFPIGQKVQATVTLHCPFGVFVDLGDPVAKGLVEVVNFLDAGRMTAEQYPPVGATITAVVIGHTEEARKQIWLSMRPSDLEKQA